MSRYETELHNLPSSGASLEENTHTSSSTASICEGGGARIPLWVLLTATTCVLSVITGLAVGVPGIVIARSVAGDLGLRIRHSVLNASFNSFMEIMDEGIANIRHQVNVIQSPLNFSHFNWAYTATEDEVSALVPYDIPAKLLEFSDIFPRVQFMGWRCFENDTHTTITLIDKNQFGKWAVGFQDWRNTPSLSYFWLDRSDTTWGPSKFVTNITFRVYNQWNSLGEIVKPPKYYPSVGNISLRSIMMAFVSESQWGPGKRWIRWNMVTTSSLEAELKSHLSTKNSRSIVMDADGFLVGTSLSNFSIWKNTTRKSVTEIDDHVVSPLIRALRKQLNGKWNEITDGFAITSGGITADARIWKHNENSTTFIVLLVVPQTDFTGESNTLIVTLIILVPCFTVLSSLAGIIISFFIARPLNSISERLKALSELQVTTVPRCQTILREVDSLQQSYFAMRMGMKSFAKYIPQKLCMKVIAENKVAELGVKPTEVSVVFADIENFTPLVEKENPEKVFCSLGECFDMITHVIHNNDGTVDKFIGDAVMAFWNEPNKVENHPLRALQSVFECMEQMEKLKEKWSARGKPSFSVKFGVSTGEALVGNVGATERFNYTIMGKPVNEAARLEPLTRFFHVPSIVTESVAYLLQKDVLFRELRTVLLKGMKEPRRLFEPICMLDLAFPHHFEMVLSYETALKAINEGDFSAAKGLLDRHVSKFPEDKPGIVLQKDCDEPCAIRDLTGDYRGTHECLNKTIPQTSF